MPRTVIVAHGHPMVSAGGGEIAAHRHFEYMRGQNEDVFFLGSIRPDTSSRFFASHDDFAKVGDRDFLIVTEPMNPYLLNFQNVADEDRFLGMLLAFNADIYHFHHIWNVGARTVHRLMKAKPEAKFLLTLHELLMICANHGQMVKARTNVLCHEANPFACTDCLPLHRPFEFYLRRLRLLRLLERFDLILAPSEFLRARHIAWGVSSDAIKVIENGMPEFENIDDAEWSDDSLRKKIRRFAFFGKCTPTKGLDVLVNAAAELSHRDVRNVYIDIWGVTLDQFRATYPDIEVADGFVRFLGPYQPQDVVARMHGYGWIIVSSTWWENSPLVIQEAKLAGTPVIAANVGGMREKVQDWGQLFDVGSPHSLADVIEECSGDLKRYKSLRERIGGTMSMETFHRIWTLLAESIDTRPKRGVAILKDAPSRQRMYLSRENV